MNLNFSPEYCVVKSSKHCNMNEWLVQFSTFVEEKNCPDMAAFRSNPDYAAFVNDEPNFFVSSSAKKNMNELLF